MTQQSHVSREVQGDAPYGAQDHDRESDAATLTPSRQGPAAKQDAGRTAGRGRDFVLVIGAFLFGIFSTHVAGLLGGSSEPLAMSVTIGSASFSLEHDFKSADASGAGRVRVGVSAFVYNTGSLPLTVSPVSAPGSLQVMSSSPPQITVSPGKAGQIQVLGSVQCDDQKNVKDGRLTMRGQPAMHISEVTVSESFPPSLLSEARRICTGDRLAIIRNEWPTSYPADAPSPNR